jgi:hypothetical protein
MMSQNRALLAKLGWRILKDEDTLWVKSLKNKYLKNNAWFVYNYCFSSSLMALEGHHEN